MCSGQVAHYTFVCRASTDKKNANLIEEKEHPMLGEKIGEETGKVTVQRALASAGGGRKDGDHVSSNRVHPRRRP